MNIRKKFGILFIGILISACAVNLPNNTKNIFDKNYNSYAEQTKLEKQKFLDKMKLMYKNKKPFDGIADISINTNLLSKNSNKSFSVKYKKDETNLRKSNVLGNRITNSAHKTDKNIFDIFNPNSLGNLSPYDGDLTSGSNSEIKVSGFSLNGEKETLFEQGVLILDFKDKNDVNTFNSLYGGQILEELNGMYRVKVDLNKSPYQNLESLITKYNNAIAVNVNRFEFSSLASLKLFCIVLDFSLNHKNSLNFIALNQASNDLPTTSSSDGVQARPYYPDDWSTRWNVLPSGANDTTPNHVKKITVNGKTQEYWSSEISGWPWRATNVTRAWNYSIGTNVSIGWIENATSYKVNHPEIKRRLKMYGDSNQAYSGVNLENDLIDQDNYDGCNNWLTSDCNAEGQTYHGHYALMTCCAERNNNIPTVGVAPNVLVNPYSMSFLYSTAKSIETAIYHGNNIIGINQAWNFNPFISYFYSVKDTASIIGFSGEEVLKKSIKKAVDSNIPVVVAAHNYAKNIITDNWYPANYDNVITVGYVQADAAPSLNDTENMRIGRYRVAYSKDAEENSNGKGSNYGKSGMIWAPGGDLDVSRYELDLSKIPNKYKVDSKGAYNEQNANKIHFGFGGTSGGTPFTLGVISLMMSRNPALTPAEIQSILVNTSQYGELIDTTNTPVSNQTDLHLINARVVNKVVS